MDARAIPPELGREHRPDRPRRGVVDRERQALARDHDASVGQDGDAGMLEAAIGDDAERDRGRPQVAIDDHRARHAGVDADRDPPAVPEPREVVERQRAREPGLANDRPGGQIEPRQPALRAADDRGVSVDDDRGRRRPHAPRGRGADPQQAG
ncbi:MAG: hypothetical protein NT062_04235 [Proteobacteria bacterium]|nr:hypothetical protein [Pseudomonadota bacterium]